MKAGDLIKKVTLKGKTTIDLDQIYPIKPLDDSDYNVKYYIDDKEQSEMMGVYYADKIIVSSKTKEDVNIICGHGYLAKKADEWSDLFVTDGIWQGGDGIFSFNIKNGKDHFDQEYIQPSLFVFGDSFIGQYDPKTQKRLQPHLMPNNTIAYLKENKVDFRVNTGDLDDVKGFYQLPKRYDYIGPIARNLVTYEPQKELDSYLSAYNPKTIEVIFDLYETRKITSIEVYNYFSKESDSLSKRGMKDISFYGSNDQETWVKINDYTLNLSHSMEDVNKIDLDVEYRYIKLFNEAVNGKGNYNDEIYQEGLFGLNKVKFINNKQLYRDIEVITNSVLRRESEHGWLWLQDGVVINKDLYFLPLIVGPDQSQPEGLQFKIMGVNCFKTPIVNGEIKPELSEAKFAPISAYEKDSSYFFGAGIMANTENAGAMNPDGYIYIYGYKTTLGLREMIVARVKEERFEYFDEWTYFDGKDYSDNILDSQPLLGHISCEMSVSQIREGHNKGKYIAVFTYDVDTPFVAFALGDTPVGPFTKPQTIYHTPEQSIFKSTTYTYNAKAHPHLSNSKRILVSYNTNTYNFEHNMSHRLIYRPRFIYLNEI